MSRASEHDVDLPDPILGNQPPIERYTALDALPVVHGFVAGVPGINVVAERAVAMARLEASHRQAREILGLAERSFVTAEQVHGKQVAVFVEGDRCGVGPVAGVDALVTNRPDLCLGIYVADCCPVFLVDPVRRVIGLAHSGKKGTELNITAATAEAMRTRFGTVFGDVTALLGPCIRPPWYEVDFAGEIAKQCRALGFRQIVDSGICTAANPEQYYSYRREQGQTGRMLALLALA